MGSIAAILSSHARFAGSARRHARGPDATAHAAIILAALCYLRMQIDRLQRSEMG
jgi:hypothetical protein